MHFSKVNCRDNTTSSWKSVFEEKQQRLKDWLKAIKLVWRLVMIAKTLLLMQRAGVEVEYCKCPEQAEVWRGGRGYCNIWGETVAGRSPNIEPILQLSANLLFVKYRPIFKTSGKSFVCGQEKMGWLLIRPFSYSEFEWIFLRFSSFVSDRLRLDFVLQDWFVCRYLSRLTELIIVGQILLVRVLPKLSELWSLSFLFVLFSAFDRYSCSVELPGGSSTFMPGRSFVSSSFASPKEGQLVSW